LSERPGFLKVGGARVTNNVQGEKTDRSGHHRLKYICWNLGVARIPQFCHAESEANPEKKDFQGLLQKKSLSDFDENVKTSNIRHVHHVESRHRRNQIKKLRASPEKRRAGTSVLGIWRSERHKTLPGPGPPAIRNKRRSKRKHAGGWRNSHNSVVPNEDTRIRPVQSSIAREKKSQKKRIVLEIVRLRGGLLKAARKDQVYRVKKKGNVKYPSKKRL